MKRKLLALVCALALLVAISVPASAACPWQGGPQSAGTVLQTDLNYQSSESRNLYSYLLSLFFNYLQGTVRTTAANDAAQAQEETENTGFTVPPSQPVQKQAEQKSLNDSGCSRQAQEVLELVNEYRAQYGLAALTLDDTLCTVAQVKAQDLHDNHYFSHQSPTYGSPYDLMADYGVTYRSAGENIAMGYASAQAVMSAWINSSSHRENLLNASYTMLGVGYVADGGYYVQEFTG